MKESVLQHGTEIGIFLSVFFAPLGVSLAAIGFLILIDTFTGIYGTIKTKGVKEVTSRKASRIINKLIFYPLAIIVAKVFEDYFAVPIPVIDVTAGILATVEVKSIYENMSTILGFDLWKKIKDAIVKDKTEHGPEIKDDENVTNFSD